jgi:putative resolvase
LDGIGGCESAYRSNTWKRIVCAGCRIVVADPGETNDDFGRDMIEVLKSMCARLYGRRSAHNQAMRALTAAKPDPDQAA